MTTELHGNLTDAVGFLERAQTPLFLLGPDTRAVVASDVLALAERLGAPVLTTPDAKSLVDEASPSAGGVFSFGATARTIGLVKAADLVVAIGTNLGEFASQSGRAFPRAAIVHIVVEASEMPIGLCADVTLVGDLAASVQFLAAAFALRLPAVRWFESITTAARLDPVPAGGRPRLDSRGPVGAPASGAMHAGDAVRAIRDALPEHARLACDVTSAALHLLHGLTLGPEQRLWLQIERSACMGTAIAAGFGVRLASDLPTLVVIGDWAFMMSGSAELHTIASAGVDRFVIVVWSNAGGALIRTGVRAQGIDVPPETHSWAPPSFAAVARGYGMRAVTVRSPEDLRRAAAAAMRSSVPVLIDALIDPDSGIPGAEDRYLHLDSSASRQ